MSALSDTRSIINEAQRQGWRLIERSKHIQLYSPNGKSIVTVSRSGQRSPYAQANLLKELRSGGFNMGATTSLGDALREARAKSPARPVRDVILSNIPPEGIKVSKLHDLICLEVPGYPYSNLTSMLAYLARHKLVHSPSHGIWRFGAELLAGSNPLPASPVSTESPPLVVADQTPPPIKAEIATHPPAVLAGDPSNLEQDLIALDEALAALGRIESVVRRHKEVIQQLATLKSTLNSFGAIK